jgi:hypothetical protein
MLTVDLTELSHTETHNTRTTLPPHEDRLKFLNAKGLKFENHQLTDQQLSELTALLYEFQDIFCADYETMLMSNLPPYRINIEDDRPIRVKRYPLSPQMERVMEKVVDKMIEMAIQTTKEKNCIIHS